MGGRLYFGNQMVMPVIGNGTISGRELTANGTYQIQQNAVISFPKDIKDVGAEGFQYYYYDYPALLKVDDYSIQTVTGRRAFYYAFSGSFTSGDPNASVVFHNLETISGPAAFAHAFASSNVKTINFEKLKTITGNDAFTQCCTGSAIQNIYFNALEEVTGEAHFWGMVRDNGSIKNIEFRNLKRVSGDGIFYQAFLQAGNIQSVNFDSLEFIETTEGADDSVVYSAFGGNNVIEEISMPNLKEVGNRGLYGLFTSGNLLNLKRFLLPALETVGDRGLTACFSNNYTYSVKEMIFDSLKNLQNGSEALRGFSPTSLKIMIFKSLDENSFGSYTNQFQDMLSRCIDCFVYFPSVLENVIGDWADVIAGFGGTNTTVIFKIPMELIIETIPDTAEILFNGYRDGNKIMTTDNITSFIVHNNSENKNVLCSEDEFIEGGKKTVEVDMGDYTYIKVNIDSGMTDSNSKLFWNNVEMPMAEESEGVYSCYINNIAGETLTYKNDGSVQYKPANYSFTTTGDDISLTITPVERQTRTFNRPNLSSNGVLGGNAFAVSASNEATAYSAVDSSTSTSWYSIYGSSDNWYVIYNPNALYINSVKFTWQSYSYRATKIVLQGSNDGQNWKALGTYSTTSSSTYTLNTGGVGFYKYYKFVLTRSSQQVGIKNITFDALEDVP